MRPRGSLRRDEGGQLMLLAGIVITIAFLMTSLTLSQVASLQRQAASEKPSSIAAEWRFLHDRIQTNLDSAVPPDLKLDAFKQVTFPTIAATFRAIEAEKGYDAVIRLADLQTKYPRNESSILVDGGGYSRYEAWASDGAFHFQERVDADPRDGVVYYTTCPDETVVGGCIAGVLVFVQLSDHTSTMSEVILFSVNRPSPAS